MPQETTRTEQWNAPLESCYNVLIDYPSYPHFVPGVRELEVLSQSDAEALVRYSINVIKKFQYTLKLTHQHLECVSWTLEGGDLFKENNGSWKLSKIAPDKTEVTYALSVEFKRFVPRGIIDSLVKKQLPAMMGAFHQRICEQLS